MRTLVLWLRWLLGFRNHQYRDNSSRPRPSARWVDVRVRELTAEELLEDPRQARVVRRRRWLDREPRDQP